MKLNRKGFTLVEIMIVVAIIIILAAISIPSLLRMRLNANEAAAIASLRTLSTACESYRAAQTPPTYPADLDALADADPAYIDSVMAAAVDADNAKQGYYFTYTQDSANLYSCIATPADAGVTGKRYFYVDEAGVLYASDEEPSRDAKGSVVQ